MGTKQYESLIFNLLLSLSQSLQFLLILFNKFLIVFLFSRQRFNYSHTNRAWLVLMQCHIIRLHCTLSPKKLTICAKRWPAGFSCEMTSWMTMSLITTICPPTHLSPSPSVREGHTRCNISLSAPILDLSVWECCVASFCWIRGSSKIKRLYI